MSRASEVIQMTLLHERLLSVAEDVGHILIRGAFSSNIKERKDCSTALFDKSGRLIAQADHMPIHIGSLLWGVNILIKRQDKAGFNDGEAWIMNDPYLAGGTHLPDISIITPVFVDESLAFFVGNIAHHADVGGPAPGSVSGNSPTIFHEGIRLPPIRIVKDNQLDQDLIELISNNTRAPLERILDLKTQIGANELGRKMLGRLVSDFGLPKINQGVEKILDYTEARIRSQLKNLKDGEYTAIRYLDDDGAGKKKIPLSVKATIKEDNIELDFSGSGRTAGGAVNLSASSLDATIAYCIKSLLDPSVPANSGLLKAVKTVLPSDSIVNPSPPAAVAARAVTSNRLAGAIFEAINKALPKTARMAASNDSTSLLVLAGEDQALGGNYVYPESIGGGGGARSDSDGMDAVHVHTVNSTNLPIEVLESEYPLVCDSYQLVEDSGGPGEFRGGLGIRREIRTLAESTELTLRSDGHFFSAPGIEGGMAGSTTHVTLIQANGSSRELPSKTGCTLSKGDKIIIETLGGGGLGYPSRRKLEKIKADVLDEKISVGEARKVYGRKQVQKALKIKF